ncbi:MAG: discoidin domain-containing protein [Kiritimatiellae bacterium]|nr:discoidin domain-containing protein [Kiritimatiellia bacterium]
MANYKKLIVSLSSFCVGISVLGISEMAVMAGNTKERVEEKVSHTNKIQHVAVGTKVTASSTHTGEEGEGPPEALVDGDLNTRWSSEYSEPQEIIIDLGAPVALKRFRLHWEKAAATKYSITASLNGKEWTKVHLLYMQTKGEPEPRIDDINTKGLTARYLRFALSSCVNTEWGFSLYEIEVRKAPREKKKTGKEKERI